MTIDQVTVSPDGAARCAALIAALPQTLDGQDRRKVAPAAALGAAWGDPAVVLTCGVSDKVPKNARCQQADGLGWYVADEAAASSDQSLDLDMTTIGLEPVVHLHVPAEHRPPPAIMVQLAPALRETLASTGSCD